MEKEEEKEKEEVEEGGTCAFFSCLVGRSIIHFSLRLRGWAMIG